MSHERGERAAGARVGIEIHRDRGAVGLFGESYGSHDKRSS